ncbi:MAG TPA: peptidoglycan-binding protein [Bryobacteraceae bacterium]|nr:peptidoglycan-binding protein [Bryobacteraceae bacterium]
MALRDLARGSIGEDVRAIQQALNVWGAKPPLVEDGKFGDNTYNAVVKFQGDHHLKLVDGIVGKETRGALFPVGVATTTIVGLRLELPEFPSLGELYERRRKPRPSPSLLGPPPYLNLDIISGGLDRPSFRLTTFPLLRPPLQVPVVPDWDVPIPAAPGSPALQPLGFVYDHLELQPGAQSTFFLGGPRQDVFILTMQNVYRRGPDDGAHQEADLGVQVGTPFVSPNGPWTFNPFVQLTDVDRFGALWGGRFHWWQPYAQAGVQISGAGNPQPQLTANLFPVNLGLDAGQLLTVNFGAGLALLLDLDTGRAQAGLQLTTGLTIKLGKRKTPLW